VPRKHHPQQAQEKGEQAAAPRPAPIIDPNQVFGVEQLCQTLGLARGCIPREVKLKRLRASKRAGRYFFLGEWVLDWLRDGEIRRGKPATEARQLEVVRA
jgi:hypothetical protein